MPSAWPSPTCARSLTASRMGQDHPCLGTDLPLPLETQDSRWRNETEPQVRRAMPFITAAHEAVKQALEQARRDKMIGSSLQSYVIINTDPATPTPPLDSADSRISRALRWYEDELAATFVVSKCDLDIPVRQGEAFHYTQKFEVLGETATAHVLPPRESKCPRCWRMLPRLRTSFARDARRLWNLRPLDEESASHFETPLDDWVILCRLLYHDCTCPKGAHSHLLKV
jgi:hypothetical protein